MITWKPGRVDATVWVAYEKELLAALTITGNALSKEEMEYDGKFGHTLRRIQHISLTSRIDLCYETFHIATQTVASTLPGFQVIKRCIQYLASHPNKPTLYPSNFYDGSNVIRLTWSGNQVEDQTTHN